MFCQYFSAPKKELKVRARVAMKGNESNLTGKVNQRRRSGCHKTILYLYEKYNIQRFSPKIIIIYFHAEFEQTNSAIGSKSRNLATSKMATFVRIVKDWKMLTICAINSILDVAGFLDLFSKNNKMLLYL